MGREVGDGGLARFGEVGELLLEEQGVEDFPTGYGFHRRACAPADNLQMPVSALKEEELADAVPVQIARDHAVQGWIVVDR